MRKRKINNKKNQRKKKSRLNLEKPVRKKWVSKKQTFSNLPYVITYTQYRRNIFLTAANIRGQTKFWFNSGRCGYKGRNKVNKMAVVSLFKTFFQKVRSFGIKHVIFKYKSYSRNRWQVKKELKKFRSLRRWKSVPIYETMEKKRKRFLKKKNKKGKRKHKLEVIPGKTYQKFVRLKRVREYKRRTWLRFIAFLIENQTSFNGCRAKKKRRK